MNLTLVFGNEINHWPKIVEMHHKLNCCQGAPNTCTLIAVYLTVHQARAPWPSMPSCTNEVHRNNKIWQCVVLVSDDYGADGKWRLNFEMGGGFGWGIKLSGFGASKKRRLSASGQGVGSLGGRSKWGRMNNSPVEPVCS
jgi:hypothetical protein